MPLAIDTLVEKLEDSNARQQTVFSLLANLEKEASTRNDVGLALLFKLLANSTAGAQGNTAVALSIARDIAGTVPRQAPKDSQGQER